MTSPPEHMKNKKAQEIWKTHVELLGDRPTFHALEQLEAFAIEKARWLEALDYIEENGSTIIIRTDKGDVKMVQEAPEVKVSERARKAYLELSEELGFARKLSTK